jgi:dolichol-phosphate mannosyltransferase
MPKLSIIIPCYFNQDNLPLTIPRLISLENKYPEDVRFEYIFVDDGSKDKTYQVLLDFQSRFPDKIKVIKLSRNFGSHNATMAGLSAATGDCCVFISADLQDPPELIPEMYRHWQNGYKFVLANRNKRDDGIFSDTFSNLFHLLIRKFALENLPKGGFDFFLFDKQLKDIVLKIDEKNLFIPNLFLWLGFEYVSIPYQREKRVIGESKWTLSKKIKSFIDNFVSFSYVPLRLISVSGFFFGFLAIIYSFIIIYAKFHKNVPIQGWSSLMIVLLFVSSFIMVSLGVIGEYLWRTLDAARNRPNYIIDNIIDQTREKNGS